MRYVKKLQKRRSVRKNIKLQNETRKVIGQYQACHLCHWGPRRRKEQIFAEIMVKYVPNFKKYFAYLFVERGEGRERNINVREKHRSCICPNQGLNLQPRHVL